MAGGTKIGDASAPAAPASPRLLVVDDEPLLITGLRRMLSRRYALTLASSAAEALERLREGERFDAILCDVMMPGRSGPALLEDVRALAPDQAARVVFMTGGAYTPESEDFLATTSNPCLSKPFGPEELADALARLAAGGLSRVA